MTTETTEIEVTETYEMSLAEARLVFEHIKTGIEDSQWNFRTVRGLAQEFDLPDYVIEPFLEDPQARAELGVRKSPLRSPDGEDLYAAVDQPLSWKERLARVRRTLAHDF